VTPYDEAAQTSRVSAEACVAAARAPRARRSSSRRSTGGSGESKNLHYGEIIMAAKKGRKGGKKAAKKGRKKAGRKAAKKRQ